MPRYPVYRHPGVGHGDRFIGGLFGAPFLGGLLGGVLGSALVRPSYYGGGFGFGGYPPYGPGPYYRPFYPPYYPYF
ncbi:hypothetical protein [Jeotgalibacillus soli]|uniref:Uncharacterized protein n=1 Tax=Jeotgalibacillus soli TaxID=889306 RepID=A0A0C2V0L6_9BACL|nr:hypothetical protein KP78_38300 [Jeotgalibacillus soli]